ncbi:MAG: hypothetical protein JW763_10210 [candidate division Zixibacteria bacterium]|nr:hypothetical protein [candidate division Zixibacteria bacterium]
MELSERYQVGYTYPVFILTDSTGEVIKRWTGYTGGAKALIATLDQALSDMIGIDERVARCAQNPSFDDAVFLARYYADAKDHIKAISYFRLADKLNTNSRVGFVYDIFANTANAVWDDLLPFQDALDAADSVINSKQWNTEHMINVGRLMVHLARKKNKTEAVGKYLLAAINAASNSRNAHHQESYQLLRADYALHITHDTVEAVTLKKVSLGKGWEENRDKSYDFARWCLERKVNLAEAEQHVRKTVDLVYPGKIRAMVLNTLAEIVFARGDTVRAAKIARLAVDQEPDNEYYQQQLRRFEKGSGN